MKRRKRPAAEKSYGTYVYKTGRIEFNFAGVDVFVNGQKKPIGSFYWTNLAMLVGEHGAKFMSQHGRQKCGLQQHALKPAA